MEDLKQMWQQYDEKLQRTQALNEEVLRKMATRHSSDRLDRLRGMEYIGLFVLGGLLFLLFVKAGTLAGSPRAVQTSYGLVLVQVLGWTAWALRKLTFLSKLDAGKLPVAEMLRRVARYRLFIMRERLWGGLSALFFLLLPLHILIDYWMDGDMSLMEHPVPYLLKMIPAIIIGAIAGLWAYRKYYKDPISEITQSLQEIEDLSKP